MNKHFIPKKSASRSISFTLHHPLLQPLFIIAVFLNEFVIPNSQLLSKAEQVIAVLYAILFTMALLFILPVTYSLMLRSDDALRYPEPKKNRPIWMKKRKLFPELTKLSIDAGLITACVITDRTYLLIVYAITRLSFELSITYVRRRYRRKRNWLIYQQIDHEQKSITK